MNDQETFTEAEDLFYNGLRKNNITHLRPELLPNGNIYLDDVAIPAETLAILAHLVYAARTPLVEPRNKPKKKEPDETEQHEICRLLEEYAEFAFHTKRFADYGFYNRILKFIEGDT